MKIDLRRDVIELLVGDSLLDTRESAWTPPPPTRERGWLAQYSRLVQPIERGATLVQPPSASQLLIKYRRRWDCDRAESDDISSRSHLVKLA